MDKPVETYVTLLRALAERKGREMGPLDHDKVARRFTNADASLFAEGLESGLLRITEEGYLRSADPYQATAWLVEGNPCWPCWEYLPHAAAYVELVRRLSYPVESVRFETPGDEHGLDADLAIVDPSGHRAGPRRGEEGIEGAGRGAGEAPPVCDRRPWTAHDGRPRKATRKLAHRLWRTRAKWLWLVGPSDRRAFHVAYDPMVLTVRPRLPSPVDQDLASDWTGGHPRIELDLDR